MEEIEETFGGAARQFFDDQGYLVVRGLLDARKDIGPFKEGLGRFLNDLGDTLLTETPITAKGEFAALPLASRLAVLLGTNADIVLDLLEPKLRQTSPKFRWRSEAPSGQFPELFWLMRNERLLDAVEQLIGPEIVASATYHFNLKLSARDRQLMLDTAAAHGQPMDPSRHQNLNFVATGGTVWHADGYRALIGSHLITAWIPLTEVSDENGCLEVIPGSHKAGRQPEQYEQSVLETAVAIPASPGDVLFFRDWTVHGADPNRSESGFRAAASFRYYPIGQPADIVGLPSFIARSKSSPERELRDPDLWQRMWTHALRNVETQGPSPDGAEADRNAADALRDYWNSKISEPSDWLRLDGTANPRD